MTDPARLIVITKDGKPYDTLPQSITTRTAEARTDAEVVERALKLIKSMSGFGDDGPPGAHGPGLYEVECGEASGVILIEDAS